MAVRNQNWYDLNESRGFPFDDTATALSDGGLRIPNGIIADLKLKFPEAAGTRAWFGAVTSTKTLAAVTILAADDATTASGFVPLAAVTVRKPLVERRPYPLEAIYPGVSGWLVFGEGVNYGDWFGKFSAPTQSLIHPSAALTYADLPIPDVGIYNSATPLTGIVRLTGGTDIEIVKQCREIPNFAAGPSNRCDETDAVLRDVIVVRLQDVDADLAGAGTGATQSNLYEKYVGSCGLRPESNNCGDPEPIESIAGVLPDCCGNVTINFTGCAIVSEIKEAAVLNDEGQIEQVNLACGFVLDCGLGISEACVTPDRLPDADGNLPNQYADLCVSVTEISVGVPGEDPCGSGTFPEEEASANVDETLPQSTDFPNAASGDLFTVRSGEFGWIGPQKYGPNGQEATYYRNLSTYDTLIDPFYRKLTGIFELRLLSIDSPSSELFNAGMVLDWRSISGPPGFYTPQQFWLAEVDKSGLYLGYPSFRIAFYDNVSYSTFAATALPTNFTLNTKYQIEFISWPNALLSEKTWLQANLKTEAGALLKTLGPVCVENYGAGGNSYCGMHTYRSAARWNYFEIANAVP